MNQELDLLESRLGISFGNKRLLRQAFTHASYVNEQKMAAGEDNERLEFLGDAVLELAVSDDLFHKFGHLPEGELTKLRASIVCEASLVHFANDLGFGEYVFLGRGEELTGGRTRPALLADVFEAFIGAFYLDQGMEAVVTFLKDHIFAHLDTREIPRFSDYKTELQEVVQQNSSEALVYRIIDERGPAHERQFIAEVCLGNRCLGSGVGRSKKEAEQQAAAKALQHVTFNQHDE